MQSWVQWPETMFKKKNQTWWPLLVILVLGRWKQEAPWASLLRPPMTPEEYHQRLTLSSMCMLEHPSIHPCTHMHIHTYIHTKKKNKEKLTTTWEVKAFEQKKDENILISFIFFIYSLKVSYIYIVFILFIFTSMTLCHTPSLFCWSSFSQEAPL